MTEDRHGWRERMSDIETSYDLWARDIVDNGPTEGESWPFVETPAQWLARRGTR